MSNTTNEHAHSKTILEQGEYYRPLRRVIDDPRFNFRRLRGKWQEQPLRPRIKELPDTLRRGRVATSAMKNEEDWKAMLKRLREHDKAKKKLAIRL